MAFHARLTSLALVLFAGAAVAVDHGAVRNDDPLTGSNLRALAALAADPSLQYDPGSFLVRFNPEATLEDRKFLEAILGGQILQEYSIVSGLVHMTISTMSVEDAIALCESLGTVEYAEPDYFVHTSVIPNDPSLSQCWGLHNTGQLGGRVDADIDAPEGWDIFTGDPNFAVAVIDTGIQRTHPDLAANTWVNPGEIAGNGIDDDANGYVDDLNGWDFVNNDNNPMDDNGHGTHCSGTIGAVGNNGTGVAGVVWRCKLVGCKFLNASGSGSITAALSALQYCVGKNIKISSNSWGGGGYSASMFNALNTAQGVGHLFVAAAGNSGSNNDTTPSYPASYTNNNVIAVASTTRTDALSSFSQYGLTSVDVGAPGSDVYSTYPTNSYATLSGTSMATPHTSGVVTAIYGRNPTWTYGQVRTHLFNTVRPITALSGRCVTGGVVNLASALGVPGNTVPVVNITAPANNAGFVGGSAVTFTGTSTDTQDGNISAGMRWTSNLQSQIGTGGTFAHSTLMVGAHTITASSTDSGGLTTTATRTINISGNGGALPGYTSCRTYGTVGGVNITYTNVANEFGYQVERQRWNGSAWVETTTVGIAPVNTIAFFTPVGSGTWRYRVRGFNGAGFATWSNYANFTKA